MLKTKEQRRRDIHRLLLQKNKEKEQLKSDEKKQHKIYPLWISNILKIAKKLEGYGVSSLNSLNCAFITYYKLRQYGLDEIKIIVTSSHAWTEFKYDNEWWILDLTALNDHSLGDPIKRKRYVEDDTYKNMGRSFINIDDFENVFKNKLDYSQDEAKIAAMKDKALNKIFKK